MLIKEDSNGLDYQEPVVMERHNIIGFLFAYVDRDSLKIQYGSSSSEVIVALCNGTIRVIQLKEPRSIQFTDIDCIIAAPRCNLL